MTTIEGEKKMLETHEGNHSTADISARSAQVESLPKPKIYCFSNVRGGGEGIAIALAEDGTCLGSHWCSHEGYVSHDLGVRPGTRPDRHETYAKHYPDGYEMVFVPSSEIDAHKGLQKAFELNQSSAPETES